MTNSLFNLLLPILAYLLGSISSAVVVCKLMGRNDPREHGSKNPGATNVLRLYGKPAAILTLTGDLLKGLIPLIIGALLGASHLTLATMGVAAFVGHLYPIFFGFKGGKGVATFIGVLFGYAWPLGVIFVLNWILMAFLFKYSSLAALISSAIIIFLVSAFLPTPYYLVAVIVMVALIFWRHQSNIRNLLNGTEGKLGKKSEA